MTRSGGVKRFLKVTQPVNGIWVWSPISRLPGQCFFRTTYYTLSSSWASGKAEQQTARVVWVLPSTLEAPQSEDVGRLRKMPAGLLATGGLYRLSFPISRWTCSGSRCVITQSCLSDRWATKGTLDDLVQTFRCTNEATETQRGVWLAQRHRGN